MHEAVAIVAVETATDAIQAIYRRRRIPNSEWRSGLWAERKPGLPTFTPLGETALWLESVTSSREELMAIVSRLLPGARIEDFDIGPTLAERFKCDTNIRMNENQNPHGAGIFEHCTGKIP